MELRLNKEGAQYILGLPARDDPALFSQVILSAGELEWLSSEVSIMGFSSLDDAKQAKEELRDYLTGSPYMYHMNISRLSTDQLGES